MLVLFVENMSSQALEKPELLHMQAFFFSRRNWHLSSNQMAGNGCTDIWQSLLFCKASPCRIPQNLELQQRAHITGHNRKVETGSWEWHEPLKLQNLSQWHTCYQGTSNPSQTVPQTGINCSNTLLYGFFFSHTNHHSSTDKSCIYSCWSFHLWVFFLCVCDIELKQSIFLQGSSLFLLHKYEFFIL